MSSAIWAICRRKTLSKQAAYSSIFPPSTPGTQTWAFPNLLLAKQSTCSVEGTVRCKETRMTRLCGLETYSRLRHAHHLNDDALDTFAAHLPGCDRQSPLLRLYASCGFVCSSQASTRLLHSAGPATTASCQDQRTRHLYHGTSTWPRRGLPAPPRLGAHVPSPWPSFVMGSSRQTARHFHIDSHRRASTCGFKCPVTSWASVPPKVRSGWDIRIALAAPPTHFPSTPAFPPSIVLGCGIIWVASKHTWMPPSGRLLTPSSSSSTSSSQASTRQGLPRTYSGVLLGAA